MNGAFNWSLRETRNASTSLGTGVKREKGDEKR